MEVVSVWRNPYIVTNMLNNLSWFHFRGYCFCIEVCAYVTRMCTSVAVRECMASQIAGDGASLEGQSYIRGHHAYCMLWTSAVGEILPLRIEHENLFDCHAVAVMENDLLVRHIPRSIC